MILTKQIKMYIAIGTGILIGVLVAALSISIAKMHKLQKEYEIVLSNQTGYIRDLNAASNDIHQYQLTIEDLRYMNDSISKKMIELKDQLKIKDKHIQNLQYMASTFEKYDTIIMIDTIFKDPELCIDTTVGDKWMNTKLHLEYPSTIVISPEVISEKTVAIYSKKETIKPPKKTWIGRLFQKKHRVTKVYIDESNPYIKDQQNEFIEVTK